MTKNQAPFMRRRFQPATRATITLVVGIASVTLALALAVVAALKTESLSLTGGFLAILFALGMATTAKTLSTRVRHEADAPPRTSLEKWMGVLALLAAIFLVAIGCVSEWYSLAGIAGLLGIWALRSASGTHFEKHPPEGSRQHFQNNPSVDTIAGLVVAVLGIVVTYGFAARAFQIPTGSMEPTLYGASGSGERVIVNLAQLALADPERGDITIFRYPLGRGQDYVKRNIAQGGDLLVIYLGDIYLRRAGQDYPKIWQKRGSVRESLWFEQLAFDGGSVAYSRNFMGIKGQANHDHGALVLDPSSEEVAICRYPREGSVLNHDPSREPDPERAGQHNTEKVLDARVRTTLTIPSGGSAEVRFIATERSVTARLVAGERARLLIRQGSETQASEYLSDVVVPADSEFTLATSIADGVATLIVNGEKLEVAVPTRIQQVLAQRYAAGTLDAFLTTLGGRFDADQQRVEALNAQAMHIEFAAGGAAARFAALRIDRDVHYLGRRGIHLGEVSIESDPGVTLPYVHQVAKGGFFMLGDHSEDSLDSRAWFEAQLQVGDKTWRFPYDGFYQGKTFSEATATQRVNMHNALYGLLSEAERSQAHSAFGTSLKNGIFGVNLELTDIFGITRRFKAKEISEVSVFPAPDVPHDLVVGPLIGSLYPRPGFVD